MKQTCKHFLIFIREIQSGLLGNGLLKTILFSTAFKFYGFENLYVL